MKVFSGFVCAVAALLASNTEAKSFREYESEFSQWMTKHHLTFSDALEYTRRLENFIKNDVFILEHNAKADTGFNLGHNEFSHLSFEEFKTRKNGFQMPEGYLEERLAKKNGLFTNGAAPESVDWVKKGGVTAVKNQGQCGSCWAFSTTGAVEGATFVATGKLPNLSEQELVDCDNNGDHGCNGGLMDHAFSWIEKHGGLCSEDNYEYHAKDEVCRDCKPVVKVTGFQDVDANDEASLKVAVSQQPVSVAIEADQREFQFYKSGVFDKSCGTQLDHGVLVVGYGEEDGTKFWKIKNSWGGTWGEEGYIRISREANGPAGQCGVAMVPSYPFATLITNEEHKVQNITVSADQAPVVEDEEPVVVEIIYIEQETPLEAEIAVMEVEKIENMERPSIYEYIPEDN